MVCKQKQKNCNLFENKCWGWIHFYTVHVCSMNTQISISDRLTAHTLSKQQANLKTNVTIVFNHFESLCTVNMCSMCGQVSFLNYVPYVHSCLTYLRALRVFMPSCLTCLRALRAFAPYVPWILRALIMHLARFICYFCVLLIRDIKCLIKGNFKKF